MSIKRSIGARSTRPILAAGLVAGAALLADSSARADEAAKALSLCPGVYADNFAALAWQARELDRRPESTFSYCTRSAATYECLSYARDGAMHRQRRKALLHGTAFAYKREGGRTFLLTNDHVAAWPSVTDADHAVAGIPEGCKKVGEALTLVDDDGDRYARDDLAVTRVVSDSRLDVAVLQTAAKLNVMPWKIGRSAALRERNAIVVRGFPFGALRTTDVGMVISAHDHDESGGWDHDDFVVDALLSSGNSGSPVLAVSCTTGEYELVGIYHAGYGVGGAVNVAVGIDQIRDLMTTFEKAPPGHATDAVALDASARRAMGDVLDAEGELFFPFGAQVASARRAASSGYVFTVYGKAFPTSPEPVLVVEDVWPSGGAGAITRHWLGSTQGLKGCVPSSLTGDEEEQLQRLTRALRADAVAHARYRAFQRVELGSREAADDLKRRRKALARNAARRVESLHTLDELAKHLAPRQGERGVTLAEVVPFAPAGAIRSTPDTPVAEGPKPPSR